MGEVILDVANYHGGPWDNILLRNLIKQLSCISKLATLGVHINEGGGYKKVGFITKDESLLVGLLAGSEIGKGGAGFNGAGEGGTVGFERELSHGRESSKGFDGVTAPSQVSNDWVPWEHIRFVQVPIEERGDIGICRNVATHWTQICLLHSFIHSFIQRTYGLKWLNCFANLFVLKIGLWGFDICQAFTFIPRKIDRQKH